MPNKIELAYHKPADFIIRSTYRTGLIETRTNHFHVVLNARKEKGGSF